MPEAPRLRLATSADGVELERLIQRSARALCAGDYSPEQIEGALAGAFGVDTQLIDDGTYFVADGDRGRLIAAGGWSCRRTLFGSDSAATRDVALLDPATEAAKIRAFFVDPGCARLGFGRRLLERCEREARARGFRRFELMATLSGERLYRRYGYVSGAAIQHSLEGELTIRFVPMSKG